jgi:hypothetical protein
MFFYHSAFEGGYSTTLSVRVSLKTASYDNLNRKFAGDYTGFNFHCSKAPNGHYCDVVIAVQFDLVDKTKVVAAHVFDAKEVYTTDRKRFCWNKSAHLNKKFNMTNIIGRQGFKDHIAFFMKTDEERKECSA